VERQEGHSGEVNSPLQRDKEKTKSGHGSAVPLHGKEGRARWIVPVQEAKRGKGRMTEGATGLVGEPTWGTFGERRMGCGKFVEKGAGGALEAWSEFRPVVEWRPTKVTGVETGASTAGGTTE
jgi:hypothetical protein